MIKELKRREKSTGKTYYSIIANRQYYHIIIIHNSSLQPFIQEYDLAAHTTYIVFVNFIYEWRVLQFKVDS